MEGCSLGRFEEATGLSLMTRDGQIKGELPPITQFLNRVLALPIALQNLLFDVFDGLLTARVEAAVQAGSFDVGVETLSAASLTVVDRRVVYTHPGTGAETRAFEVRRLDRTDPFPLEEALARAAKPDARLLVNARSGHAALQVPASSITLDDGEVEGRIRLMRPTERKNLPVSTFSASHWEEVDEAPVRGRMDQRDCQSARICRESGLDHHRSALADLAATPGGRLQRISPSDG